MNTSKIIKGAVSNGHYTVTAPIVKEDYGLYLQIEGVELPSTYEVDFSNSENSGSSVTMIGNADGVLIPRQFISTGKDVFAFLYHVGADFGRTVYKFRIPNKVRPDRTNEEPTPEEQSTIDQAISALNEAVAQTAGDVESADQSAQSAKEDADRAEQAKDDASTFAQRSANSAQASSDYSESAQASATASANSASASAQIKANVEELVDDAQASADASERSASNAYTYATSAERSSVNASSSAQSASGYASSAQTSANTASAKAQDTSTSAQTASEKASESAQSASQALTYKTDAESAKTASQTAQGLAESARDSAVSAKNDAEQAKADAESARDEAQSIVDGISGALDDKADIITDTASGSIACFSDGADNLPLKSLVVDINPVQDLHGQESPWPAGGGKNLFNPDTVVVGYIDDTTGGLTETSIGLNSRASEYIAVDGGTSYFFANNAPFGRWGAWYDENKGYISSCNGVGVKTAPSAAKYVRITVSHQNNNPDYADNVMVAKSTTEISYAPYENICPISGWTEVDVEQKGKNLCDVDTYGRTLPYTTNGITFSKSANGNYHASGTATGSAFFNLTFNSATDPFMPATPFIGKNLFVSVGNSKIEAYLGYFRQDNTFTQLTNGSIIPAEAVGLRCYTVIRQGTTIDDDFYPQIELGSIATPYEPYTGRSITIDLGQTVYGAKLYPLEGKAVIDRAMVDLGTLDWYNTGTATSGINRFGYSVESLDIKLPSANNVRANMICDRYATETADGTYLKRQGIAINASNKRIFVFDPLYNDVADLENADHLTFFLCYELATPIEIQLSANQINSLLGANNIWADSGDTEVEYRADTKLYIAKKIAEAISALS